MDEFNGDVDFGLAGHDFVQCHDVWVLHHLHHRDPQLNRSTIVSSQLNSLLNSPDTMSIAAQGFIPFQFGLGLEWGLLQVSSNKRKKEN